MKNSISGKPIITVRKGNLQDLQEMLILFQDTITTTCQQDYSPSQLEAWKSGSQNHERWQNMMEEQYILIAESENTIVGFCTLDKENYIDLLFIHKDYQRLGIAFQLYKLLEKEALLHNQKVLTAEVSKTAKPFFESMGFKVIKEQTVNVKGVDIINYKMEKRLVT